MSIFADTFAQGAALRRRHRLPDEAHVRGSRTPLSRGVLLLGLLGLLGLLARAGIAVLRGLLAPTAASVVGRVEAGALEVHRDRMQHDLERALAADGARLGRRGVDRLEHLEQVPFGT